MTHVQSARRAAILVAAVASRRRAQASHDALRRAERVSRNCTAAARRIENAVMGITPLPWHGDDIDELINPNLRAIDEALHLIDDLNAGGARS